MIRQLQPWFENLGKRQVKAPKAYVRDSGLLHTFFNLGSLDAVLAHMIGSAARLLTTVTDLPPWLNLSGIA